MNLIGKIRSLHGVKGDVIFEHNLPPDFDFDNLDAILIELIPNSYIPFFVDEYQEINDSEVILKLEEYDDRNSAMEILTKNVYAPEHLKLDMTTGNPWANLKGAQLYDQYDMAIGTITDIIENGAQVLLDVKAEHKSYLIPFAEPLILNFNLEKNHLQLEIADGLLDL
jgi:16S rRNA processing protein RimM